MEWGRRPPEVKRWLAKQEVAPTVGELQAGLDRFRTNYNECGRIGRSGGEHLWKRSRLG